MFLHDYFKNELGLAFFSLTDSLVHTCADPDGEGGTGGPDPPPPGI